MQEKESGEMAAKVDELKDLVSEILSRLPVKSLMRFQCVEKSWSLLIKDPDFISKNLRALNQINMEDNGFCLLLKRNKKVLTVTDPLLLIDKDSVSRLSFHENANTSSPDHLPFLYNLHLFVNNLQICGPLNGIYYLRSAPRLFINPSMREYRLIPENPPIPKAISLICFDGFGYDPKTDDYKVVCIQLWVTQHLFWHVRVYSLSSNCWRNVTCPLPSYIRIRCKPLSDTFVHGSSHWWAYDNDGDFVLAFNMLDEMFKTIRFPKVRSSVHVLGNVAKFKEFIAVIICPEDGTEKQFDIWVMQDYGKEESWTKLLTIGPIAEVQRPLAFWKNRVFLEHNNGGLVLYDNETQEKEYLGFHSATQSMMAAAVYMGSLVSLRRDTYNSDETQTKVFFLDIVPEPNFDHNSDREIPVIPLR